MGPTKCSYFECNNTNASNDLSMFRFPILDESRLNIWLENCGNTKITHLSKTKLSHRYVCIEHFHKKYVLANLNGIRTRLSRYAVPKHYASEDPPSPEAPDVPTVEDPPFLEINKPLKTYSRLGPHTRTVSAGESSQNTMHNEVNFNPVNIYGYKMKEKSCKQTSRRKTAEEKNEDVESNIKGKNVVNKMEKMTQMIESSYLDDKDVKHDVAKVLQVSVDPLEMDGHVESCTAIKQEPLDIEIEFDVHKPDDTQKQATEKVTKENIEDNLNTDEVPKVAVKVENADSEETQKDENETEIETKIQQTKFEVYYPQIRKPKTPPEKTPTRILNTEIANTVVSESILESVAMKLEIKHEPDNDSIILNTSDSSEQSHMSFKPEAILNTGYRKRKCDYAGDHEEYREHLNHHCVVIVKEEIVKNNVRDNDDMQKADYIREETTERAAKEKVIRKITIKPTQVPKVAVKVENAEPEETQKDRIDLEPNIILKKEKVSDDEDAKPDVAVLEKSLIEMNDDVEMCTAIKQEPKDYRE